MSEDNKPTTVKALLAEIKDSSELMVDLAYAAVFFEDEELAEEVRTLEEQMFDHLFKVRELGILSARSPEDAHHMSGVLGIASAVENIADAAADIADIVISGLGIPDELRRDLKHADEVMARVEVRENAPASHQSLRSLSLPSEMGIWVMAVRRERNWNFNPGPDHVLIPGEILLVRGPEDSIASARQTLGATQREPAEVAESGLNGLERAVDLLVEMKNSAEAAVGLAYSALLFNDRALALEVHNLEARSDEIHEEFETWALKSAAGAARPEDLRGPLHLAQASERMFDAAREMTRLVEKGEELHPVVAAALVESDEIGYEAVIGPRSQAVSKSIKELRIESATGMFVLAVQRGRRWTYRPSASFVFQSGDRVISVGPDEGGDKLGELFGVDPDEEEEN
jgi:uncharacterized protein with PhoU and TrkA domain